jgi:hypothetical protein
MAQAIKASLREESKDETKKTSKFREEDLAACLDFAPGDDSDDFGSEENGFEEKKGNSTKAETKQVRTNEYVKKPQKVA